VEISARHGPRQCAAAPFLWRDQPPHCDSPQHVLPLGGVTLLGCFVLSFDCGAELLNFGAFIEFVEVNLSALLHYRFEGRISRLINLTLTFGPQILRFNYPAQSQPS
jgi:hypothetical protein